ncbi:MAG TPA: FkbM family methyltransferase [Alphaproteobacteria bacterium]|nr:FkbM family methyltransferase [Alphaproteobacteria bacterium]
MFGLKKRHQKLDRVDNETQRVVQLLELHGIEAVIDIGANEGQYARGLREAGYRGRIISVEPGADAHGKLQAAVADDPHWTAAARMALGETPGDATLHLSNRSDMNSLKPMAAVTTQAFPKAVAAGTDMVAVARLDVVFDELVGAAARRVFVKIDTQGFEAEILRGATAVLDRIAGFQLELSLLPLYEGETTYLAVLEQLDALGFELHLVLSGNFSRRLGRQLQFDGVFFRR